MKKTFYLLFISICTLAYSMTCVSCSNNEEKYRKEYNELIEDFQDSFAKTGSDIIFISAKQYIIVLCADVSGQGLKIIDISQLSYEEKLHNIKPYRTMLLNSHGSIGYHSWADNYIRKTIDNYQNYGQEFTLIWPNDQQYPTPLHQIL